MSSTDASQAPMPLSSDAPKGAGLALNNARRHLRAAELLGAKRLFGPGVSHLVLATEELAKAWILALLGAGVVIPDRMLRDTMRRHDARQAFIAGDVITILIQHLATRTAKRVQRRHRVKHLPPELRDEWVRELEREVRALARRTPEAEPVLAIAEWIGSGNEGKNAGFYVDFGPNGWTHPGQVAARRFGLAYGVTQALLRRRSRFIRQIIRTRYRADSETIAAIKQVMDGFAGITDPEKVIAKVAAMALHSPFE